MDKDRIIQYLENRVKDNPNSILFARLADYYLKENRFDEAIELCKNGIEHNPEYITGNYVLGKAYLAIEDWEKAESEFKKVLSYDRHYISAYKQLGDLMLKMGWENKATIYYKDILNIDPLTEEIRQILKKMSEREQQPLKEQKDEELIGDQSQEIEEDITEKLDEIFIEDENDLLEETRDDSLSDTLESSEEDFLFDIPVEENKPDVLETEEKVEQETPSEGFSDHIDLPFDFFADEKNKDEISTTPTEEKKDSDLKQDEDLTSFFEEESEIEEGEQRPEETEKVKSNKEEKSEAKIVSPTLGEIYEAQGQYAKAIEVFENLLQKDPDNKKYKEKIEQLKKKLNEAS